MPEWATNLISLVVGSALTLASGWASDRRSARRDREGRVEERRATVRLRRNDFQRETLLQLQDAAMRLIRSTAAAIHQDTMAFQSSGQWQKQDISEPFNEDFRIATAELRMLATRVRDDQVRSLADEFRKRCAAAVQSESPVAATEALVRLLEAYKVMNDSAGKLIRDLDELE